MPQRADVEGRFRLVRENGEPVCSESAFQWDRGGPLDAGGREPGQALIGQVWSRGSRVDRGPATAEVVPTR